MKLKTLTLNEGVYLGDGVYMDFDGYHVILKTRNSIGVNNIIYLPEEVLVEFVNHVVEL